MTNIELVIKIPKENYERLKFMEEMGALNNPYLETIANGTPLPKGHGRLIDADAYAKNFDTNINGRIGEEYVFAPTIIKADKAESEEQKND